MAQFGSVTPATFTPAANANDVNHLVVTFLTAGDMGKIKAFNWGGSGTSLVGYITRWARVTNTPVTASARLIQTSGSPSITPKGTCNTYTGTSAQATADAALFKTNWNVQGGGGTIVLPIGGEWALTGGALGSAYNQIGCGNNAGADANLSNYGFIWEE